MASIQYTVHLMAGKQGEDGEYVPPSLVHFHLWNLCTIRKQLVFNHYTFSDMLYCMYFRLMTDSQCVFERKKKMKKISSGITLKWQCHKILCHFLFHESNPPALLINRLKWFFLKIRFLIGIRKISDSGQANTAGVR